MTASQIASEIFIGAVVGLITALINKSFQENINPWIIVGVAIAAIIFYGIAITLGNTPPFILIAAVLCTVLLGALLYRGYVIGFGLKPYIRWRWAISADEWRSDVWEEKRKRGEQCPGLISDGEPVGKKGREACQFRCEHFCGTVWGPYIDLPKGRYTAIFRIKLSRTRTSNKDERLARIDIVAIGIGADGKPHHASKSLVRDYLTYTHFKEADTYYNFPLNFNTSDRGDSEVEFRVRDTKVGPAMTLDYVQLYKRIF